MSGGFRHKIEPSKHKPEPRSAEGLTTDTVHCVVEKETTELVGTLRAERRTEVSSKIMATITDIAVRAGDRVKKGQVLVRLDDRDLRAQLVQAQEAVKAAEVTAKQAADDLGRFERLLKDRVISRQEYDQKETAYKVAAANLERGKSAVKEAEVAVSYAQIVAPTDGVVRDKLADKGDSAMPGKPLVVVYDPQVPRLEAPVRETLATGLRVGDRLTVRLEALDLTVEGRVDEIVPAAEAASRSVLVKVSVPRDPKMVEGMFGRLVISTGERQRYCMPLSAVVRVGQLTFADVVTTASLLERRSINLGEHSEYGRIEVISGLQAGEQVALYGPKPPPMPENAIFPARPGDVVRRAESHK